MWFIFLVLAGGLLVSCFVWLELLVWVCRIAGYFRGLVLVNSVVFNCFFCVCGFVGCAAGFDFGYDCLLCSFVASIVCYSVECCFNSVGCFGW